MRGGTADARPARDTNAHTDDPKDDDDMTPTSTPQGATDEDTPVAKRRFTTKVPIWVRVSVITGVVLVGVLLSTMLLAAGGVGDRGDSGGNHGSGGEMEMNSDDSSGGHGTGSNHGSSGSRGSGGDDGPGGEHGSGRGTD